jgi:restriction system protein
VGAVKVLGSVKAYAPNHLVGYDDIRALMGVMAFEGDGKANGLITTTSDFPPRVNQDPIISPLLLSNRLQLVNGTDLPAWLNSHRKK